jgi:hypothetical protein
VLVNQYQSRPVCDSYLRDLERRRACRQSLADERKPPVSVVPLLTSSDMKPSGMLMPRPPAPVVPSAKQPTESKPPVKLPVMPMLSDPRRPPQRQRSPRIDHHC